MNLMLGIWQLCWVHYATGRCGALRLVSA